MTSTEAKNLTNELCELIDSRLKAGDPTAETSLKNLKDAIATSVAVNVNVAALQATKGKKQRLERMLNRIDRFLSNHDGSYQEDARALWHIIGGATRGPDDEDGPCKTATINLRALAFPRTAKLGTGTGAAFTTSPKIPTIPTHGLGHFQQHASKALQGLKRAKRVQVVNGVHQVGESVQKVMGGK